MRSSTSDSGSFWITNRGAEVPPDIMLAGLYSGSLEIARLSLRLASSRYGVQEECQQKIVGAPSMNTVVSLTRVWLVCAASPGHLHSPWFSDCQSTSPTIDSAMRYGVIARTCNSRHSQMQNQLREDKKNHIFYDLFDFSCSRHSNPI